MRQGTYGGRDIGAWGQSSRRGRFDGGTSPAGRVSVPVGRAPGGRGDRTKGRQLLLQLPVTLLKRRHFLFLALVSPAAEHIHYSNHRTRHQPHGVYRVLQKGGTGNGFQLLGQERRVGSPPLRSCLGILGVTRAKGAIPRVSQVVTSVLGRG